MQAQDDEYPNIRWEHRHILWLVWSSFEEECYLTGEYLQEAEKYMLDYYYAVKLLLSEYFESQGAMGIK